MSDDTSEATTASTDADHPVRLSPVGEVQFDDASASVHTGLPNATDVAVAASRADAANSIHFPEYHGAFPGLFDRQRVADAVGGHV